MLKSEDILAFEFKSAQGKRFAAIYADGICNKELLGELAIKPLRAAEKDAKTEDIKQLLALPEVKDGEKLDDAITAVSDGNAVLFADGESKFLILGLKNPPVRTVTEPPTQVAVKGPREGFIEDFKTNVSLVRKRIKSDKLQVKILNVGKRSQTTVALVYIEGVCPEEIVKKVEERIADKTIDLVPDSSFISQFIVKNPRSMFKMCGSSEKPDSFCAKIGEGRVGIIVDGSPLALTVPYMLVEEFQSVEDYYVNSYRSTTLRILRYLAVLIGIVLPAVYVAAQLFKIQIIPYKLLLRISGSVAGLPFSPSIELFFTLFILEVLTEASIRMPKYVGLALSVVGALVLGDTAVKAGIISTPAIIIVAFSAICLYCVPGFVETSTNLRWIFLIIAGSVGPFGIALFAAYLISYLVSEQNFGVPLMAPFAPLTGRDLNDAVVKANLFSLKKRPKSLKSKNKVRLKVNEN